MNITSLAYRTPSRRLTNDDLLEHIAAENPKVSRRQRERYLNVVRKLLDKTGARTRYWRDSAGGEKAGDLVLGAMDDALAKAGLQPKDIDLLIYCGVGKGFLEPANAYFYANARGMDTVNCFDVTDACMSWVRALEISYLTLRAGKIRNAMVVNGEFHVGFHDNWEIRDLDSLMYTFPMYTIGEAATAVVLQGSDDEWSFDYRSRPRYADLCTIPLPSYTDFIEPTERIGHNGEHKFVSYGYDLFNEASTLLGELLRDTIADPAAKSLYFPHAPSKAIYRDKMPRYGVPVDKVYLEVYPEFGNLVSASLPVGMSHAERAGVLQRGADVALVPASAGIVTSVVQLTY